MAYKFKIVPDIGLKVHPEMVTETVITMFQRTWKFKAPNQAAANIAKSCLHYYLPMWVPIKEGEYKGINKSDIVLDVGAHVGYFTIPAASFAKRVIAYEPAPANFVLLKKNAVRNNCDNVTLVPEAVGAGTSTVTLNLGVQGTTGHSIANRKRGGVSVEVKSSNMRLINRRYHPTIVKLDCEGAEWEILKNPDDFAEVRILIAELHKVTPERLLALTEFMEATDMHWELKHSSWFTKLIAYRPT